MTEERQMAVEWNDTKVEYGRGQRLHELFDAQVEQTPDTVAVVFEGQRLTYQELNRRANQLAHHLRRLGVGPDVLVGICVERSLEMVVGLLGILKAGGAFLPLDPTYPIDRLEYMLADSNARLLLAHAATSRVAESLAGQRLHQLQAIVSLDAASGTCDPSSSSETSVVDNPPSLDAQAGRDLVYMMYTSGSTGRPKGIPITEQNLVPFLLWTQAHFSFRLQDRIIQYHSLSFDFSVWEIFEALTSGACLYIVPWTTARDVAALTDYIATERITVLNMTPSQFSVLEEYIRQFRPTAVDSLRIVVLGGEILTMGLARRSAQLLPAGCKLFNEYGPTEATISCTIFPITAAALELYADQPSAPIGRPIPNMQTHVLDADLQPVLVGSPGQLYIGGAGLTYGYRNQPRLTAERFLPNPFGSSPGDRLYETGDLVRCLPDGNLVFLQRVDDQVKIRGFRIELAEIEAVLNQHLAVQECAVLAREDIPGDKRLVAYVVFNRRDAVTVPEVRSHLRERLPDYMVPAAFIVLDSLPLTPNGKVDRRALPPPDSARPDIQETYVAPGNLVEEDMARIWAEVLGLARVGIHDNFFDLGGHSLAATQVMTRARDTFQVDLPMRSIFETPTVAGLAQSIRMGRPAAGEVPLPLIKRISRTANLPLSFPQERVWFLQQLEPANRSYYFQATLQFAGTLAVGALERALTEIVRRHEILRTTFPAIDGRPVQVIHEPQPVDLPVLDLPALPERERAAEVQRRSKQLFDQPFDLASLPLIRWTLLRLSPQMHVLCHIEHHLIHDGWSYCVFLRELLQLYTAFAAGHSSSLPEPSIQFADFAYWQRQWMRGTVEQTQLDYWKERLANNSPVLELPYDRPRPPAQSFRGAAPRIELPGALCKSLKMLSNDEGVTLFMTMLAAFLVLLYRYSSQEDICVGSGIANRRWRETEDLMGMLINTVVLRTDLSGNPTFRELLSRVREVTLGAYAHQDLPLDKLVQSLQPERNLSHNPLFQVMFSFDTPLPDLELPDLSLHLQQGLNNGSAKFDLNIIVLPYSEQHFGRSPGGTPDGMTLLWEYSTDLFEAATIDRMVRHFQTLLYSIVSDPEQHLANLSLLDERDRQRLLVEWNDTKVEYGRGQRLHELFDAQVEQTPDTVAVVFEGQRLTYQELNRRANQLAHHLRRLGVGPDVLVGICVERSLEMVVGLLGILKAGGAYVPLDPAYPPARLAFMLEDAHVPILLTQRRLVLGLPEHGARLLCLDTDWHTISRESAENPNSRVSQDNLAYVIYTSGSTGKPKGSMISHRGICNRLLWMQATYQLAESDRVLQKTPFSFDVSVWEFFWPLLVGARLVLARPEGHKDSGYLVKLIDEQQITTLHFVPSMLRVFLQERGLAACKCMKRVLCSGEVLPFDLQERFHGTLDAELFNLYGPTEASVDVASWACERNGKQHIVPIGRPIANIQIYLLDSSLEPVPVGVPGELHIGGVGLARGYLNRAELTAEKFIPNPFGDDPGTRLYRTGDSARYLPDGSIEYLARIDHQVKVRGFRIELGEIETVLNQHPAVGECAVLVRHDTPDDNRLVAYLVPDQQHALPVHRLLRYEREGVFAGRLRHELANGMVIACQNPPEIDFMYQEIFEGEAYLRHGIEINDGDCVFDIGANVGLFSLLVGSIRRGVEVYAFEPIPVVCQDLRTNASIHGINAHIFECGLGSSSGSEVFTYYPKLSIMSGRFADPLEDREVIRAFLLGQEAGRGAGSTDLSSSEVDELLESQLVSERFRCQLKTISEVMQEHGVERIDLLKVDVEKSEFDVLAGIREDDWRKIRQVVVEVHAFDGRLERIVALLQGRGYEVTAEQDDLLRNTGLYNVYAVRPNGEPMLPHGRSDELADATWSSPRLLIEDVQQLLRDQLPDFMVPSAFVMLDALPLTPNGKVDRQGLPAPDKPMPGQDAVSAAPRTFVEEIVRAAWVRALGLEQVGIYENFFELGGHSLLATQIIARLRDIFQVELPVRCLFKAPTVAGLAESIAVARRSGQDLQIPAIEPARRDSALPLSFAQERLWFLNQLEPNSAAYNISAMIHLSGSLHRTALERSLNEIIGRHEVLRTTVEALDGRPVQVIAPTATNTLPVVDLLDLAEAERQATVVRQATMDGQHPFDLARGPLMRTTLLRIGDTEYVLLLTMHHIISDGWSMGVLVRELTALYEAFSRDQSSPLPPLSVQYGDFAVWQRAWLQDEVLHRQLAYWREQLRGTLPVLELLTDRPRLPRQTSRGAIHSFVLRPNLIDELKALSHAEGVTLFMTLLAAWNTLLHHWTGQEDVIVGAPIAGRNHSELEGLIGFFVNTLVLRTDLSGNPSFRELLTRVRTVTLGAYAHQDVPFERLVEMLQPERDMSRNPIFQVAFTFQYAPMRASRASGVTVSPSKIDNGTAKFDLTLNVEEHPQGLSGWFEYNTDLFDRSTVSRMAGELQDLLEAIIAHPECRLRGLPARSNNGALSAEDLDELFVREEGGGT